MPPDPASRSTRPSSSCRAIPARYETRVGDNHHHIVCRACGATEDIDCAVGAAPCLEPASAGGFAVDEAEVTFWGLCPECQQAPGRELAASPNLSKAASN
ncbi:MAG: transcriptional repressor [Thermoleophilia bacterium]|nr:transcriptional repressor [Thermoleophilia bacterium]